MQKSSLIPHSMQDGQKLGQLSIWQKRFGQKNKEQLHIYFSCDTINCSILNLNFSKGNIMRKTKFIITLLMAVLMTFSSAFCVSVSAASSPDEAVISGNYDGIEPIPTEKPEDKPVMHGKGFSSGDYALFYTQTTFLALLAGYLIIFKVKGTKTKEKMHGRKLDRK